MKDIINSSENVEQDGLDVSIAQQNPIETFRFIMNYVPLSLAIREIIRLRALAQGPNLRYPILDVGCGDGLFWESIIRELSDSGKNTLRGLTGIDISPNELALCSLRLSKTGANFKLLDISSPLNKIEDQEIKSGYSTVIANCSLEHVADIELALKNIKSLLAPGGRLILFVPHPRWTRSLPLYGMLESLSPRLSGMVSGIFDGFFQHFHLYPNSVWRSLLLQSGFSDVKIQGLGSRVTNRLFFYWLPSSIPAFIWKIFFGSYPSWYSGLKIKYLEKQEKILIDEVIKGSFIVDDLSNPNLFEWYIQACNDA